MKMVAMPRLVSNSCTSCWDLSCNLTKVRGMQPEKEALDTFEHDKDTHSETLNDQPNVRTAVIRESEKDVYDGPM